MPHRQFAGLPGFVRGSVNPAQILLAWLSFSGYNQAIRKEAGVELEELFQNIELFDGLNPDELAKVARICAEKRFSSGEVIARQGSSGDEVYIITEGFVEVSLGGRSSETARVVVSLGVGQIFGEISLLDQGPRSASIVAVTSPTIVQAIEREDFDRLCQEDTHIGYVVMRNLAADLSFKLRHRNLVDR
jgi:CRP-like cAMP-binding protein